MLITWLMSCLNNLLGYYNNVRATLFSPPFIRKSGVAWSIHLTSITSICLEFKI